MTQFYSPTVVISPEASDSLDKSSVGSVLQQKYFEHFVILNTRNLFVFRLRRNLSTIMITFAISKGVATGHCTFFRKQFVRNVLLEQMFYVFQLAS